MEVMVARLHQLTVTRYAETPSPQGPKRRLLMFCKLKNTVLNKSRIYQAQGDELEIIEAAIRNKIPVLLKSPTDCRQTRFMEHVA